MRTVAIAAAFFALAVLVVPAHAGHPSLRSVAQIIRHAFPDDQRRALCIAGYESTGAPGRFSAVASHAGNDGLFEISRDTWDPARNPRALPIVGHVTWKRIFQAAYNSMVARRIYVYDRHHRADHNGWHQWSTRGLCGA